MSQLPHFLRVARGLAFVSALGTAGCARSVYPLYPDADLGDGNFVLADGNVIHVGDSGVLATGCPSGRPYPYGVECNVPGTVCDPDTCAGLRCRQDADGGVSHWSQINVCNGPLPPPDLTTV